MNAHSLATRSMVLWVPDWPIIASLRVSPVAGAPDVPLALIEKGIVFACSATARIEGVQRGLRVREAQARCTDLVVRPYEQQLDARTFLGLVANVEELMPGVQLLRPGILAVRSRGPARFYGGEKPAGLALVSLFDSLAVPGARVGIADGPFTAEQAARTATRSNRVRVIPEGQSDRFLAELSVSLLDDTVLIALLRRLGITRLGQFAALPPEDVLGRFGPAGARLHALAGGFDSRPIVPHVPPEELDVTVAFEPALDRVDQVTFGVRASADDFVQRLISSHLVCTTLRIEIETELGDYSERSWLHPRSFSAADVVDRVRWQLQGSAEVDSGLRSGVSMVRIVPETVDAIGNHEAGLFGEGPDERIHNGLARVQSMLGHEGVLTAVLSGGRTLADRQVTVPWGDRPVLARSAGQPWPGQLPDPLPATVFAAPRPVSVVAEDGSEVLIDERGAFSATPARFSPAATGKNLRRIRAWAGPWPVSERWWDSEAALDAHRFQIVDEQGVAWLLVLTKREGTSSWAAEARYD
ncbi:MAG TPA: DNA polymerase Y family protein [Galbitalea sp.]|jgi:protein ImuB|nr:DNA polymerase Y family protein [Galbitalea sp.]